MPGQRRANQPVARESAPRRRSRQGVVFIPVVQTMEIVRARGPAKPHDIQDGPLERPPTGCSSTGVPIGVRWNVRPRLACATARSGSFLHLPRPSRASPAVAPGVERQDG